MGSLARAGGGAAGAEGGGGGGNANTPRTPPVAIVNPAIPGAAADQAWYNSQFRPYAQGGQQGGIAVGRLDDHLGLRVSPRQSLQFADARGARSRLLRQVADKGEALAIQAAGRQRHQQ